MYSNSPPDILPPRTGWWLAREGDDGPVLLHVPGQSDAGPGRIRLFAPGDGGFRVVATAWLMTKNDPVLLKHRRLQYDQLTNPRPRTPAPARPAPRPLQAPAPALPPVPVAAPPRLSSLAQTAERRRLARTAALERYRSTPPSGACRVLRLPCDGALRTAVYNPLAQGKPQGLALWLVPQGASGEVEAWVLEDVSDPGRIPESTGCPPAEEATALEVYRAWSEEEAAIRAIPALAAGLVAPVMGVEAPSEVLQPTMEDVRLARLWTRGHRAELDDRFARAGGSMEGFRRVWSDTGSDRPPGGEARTTARGEMERTLSARVAEKAARWFYGSIANGEDRVHDVAVEQLRPHTATRTEHDVEAYRLYDLEVDDATHRLVDVKNCRVAFVERSEFLRRLRQSHDRPSWWGTTYGHHFVRGFVRPASSAVRFAGVLSPYRSIPELLDARGDGPPVTFLGEARAGMLADLAADRAQRYGITISLNRDALQEEERHGAYLPPWLFRLPDAAYPARPLRLWRDMLRVAGRRWSRLDEEHWPLYMAAAKPGLVPHWEAAFPASVRAFVGDMLVMPAGRRLWLPSLYLSVLGHFLRQIRTGKDDAGPPFDAAALRKLLFYHDLPERPLGLWDPLRTVHDLIGSLDLLQRGALDRIREYTEFEFGYVGVLKAKRPGECAKQHLGGGWDTLLFPYCGGEPCGRERLVLGSEGTDLCDACGHLICPAPECRFCGIHCVDERERRRERLPRPESPRAAGTR